ncbi:MAG: C40 family peptidase, partial [Demequina sp.]
MRYGYLRAKSRAVIAAAGAAIVMVPLTGAAAATLVAREDEPVIATAAVVAEDRTAIVAEKLASDQNSIATVSTTVTASSEAEVDIETPKIKVKEDPPPPPPAAAPSASRAQPVANSSNVRAAISGSAVIAEASKYVGTPYVSGGASPSGFDCSGFTSYVFGKLGISLPRTSGAYYGVGTRVSSPQPGDIIVSPGHVGIYAGPNLQIDAPRPGKSVQ